MPVYKRTYRSGQTVWSYVIDAPNSTRENRQQITGSGFATKHEAQDAEAQRRTEELQKKELAKLGRCVVGPLPRTLSMLMDEFFRQHVDEKLAPKTVERYHEQAAYLDPGLLAMALADITPLCQGRSQSFPPRRRKRGPLSVFHSRLFLGVWGRLKRSPATRLRGAFRAERKPPPNAAHNIRDR